MEIRKEVANFLLTDAIFSHVCPSQIEEDFPLIESDLLDSVGIFHLISFLEKRFGIRVEVQDLSEDNFSNLVAIEKFVLSKS